MRVVRLSIAMALLVICAMVGSSAMGASVAASPGRVVGNVDPALDVIAPGTVGVVASGAPVGGVVAVIVQNRMPYAVTGIRIDATAVDGLGQPVARAATRRLVPTVLAPEALGLARLDFENPRLPPGLTYRFDVNSEHAKGGSDVALEPTMFRLSPPRSGPVAQTLAVTLRNPTKAVLIGPVRVAVMCFGEARRPVVLVTKRSPEQRLPPRASARTRIALDELCPAYVVGATARRR